MVKLSLMAGLGLVLMAGCHRESLDGGFGGIEVPAAKPGANEITPGITVRMLGISQDEMGTREVEYSVNDRSWFPDGSPYSGVELRGNQNYPGRMFRHSDNIRYLTFAVHAQNADPADVYGYVPGVAGAEDWPNRLALYKDADYIYRTPIQIADLKANRYRFGLATGPQTLEFETTKIPTTPVTQDIAKGSWGTLRLIEPPKQDGIATFRMTMPVLTFSVVDTPAPAASCYEVRLYDKSGKIPLRQAWIGNPQQISVSTGELAKIGKIAIYARPYKFVEFRDVHFDRDAAKWGPVYWGAEGKKAVSYAPGVGQLDGILQPKIDGQGWTSSKFFAPDGILWRDFPGRSWQQPFFSTNDWPKGEPLVALIGLSPSIVANDENVRVEIYPSSSSQPGRGLQTKLKPQWPFQFNREQNQALFARPSTPYVQFELRKAQSKWTTAGSVPPPNVALVKFTLEQKEQIKNGVNVGVTAFNVIIRPNGSLAFFYQTPEEPNNLKENMAKWEAGDREVRLMAKLKTGGLIPLSNNGASGTGDREFLFNLAGNSVPFLDSYKTKVALKDIATFEVQTRGYGKPAYVVAKLPPPVSKGP